MKSVHRTSTFLVVVSLCFIAGFWPHTTQAAVTYDFESDTIGQTPANTSVGAGTFDVQDQIILGKSLRAVTQVGVIAAINFDSFASTTDQSVVWKQAYSDSLGRSGFTLRSQSEDTNTVNSAGAKQGYLFHVYESTVYIWRVGASGYTSLWSGSLAKAQPRWFKAIAQGTALGFYYSDDGNTYTKLASTTDSTYSAGRVQYTAGYGSSVNRDYVDSIVITNLSTPDTTAPSITLTAPTASGAVSGSSVALSATASDDTAVAGVRFYIDGVAQGSEDTSSAYGVTWNSTATSSGAHTAFAVARDTSNNYATSSTISFTVDNAGPVFSGIATAVSNTGVHLTWTSDELASSQISYGVTTNYGELTSEVDTSPRVTSHTIDVSGLAACTLYHFQVKGIDAFGNTGVASDTTFTTTGCGSRSVSTIQDQVKNLLAFGDIAAANMVKAQWPHLFLVESPASVPKTSPYTSGTAKTVRDLILGMTGDDVLALQKLLNTSGAPVATTGIGSVGNETAYFGLLTKSALASYQKTHNILPAVGYFGPLTRTQMKTAQVNGVWW